MLQNTTKFFAIISMRSFCSVQKEKQSKIMLSLQFNRENLIEKVKISNHREFQLKHKTVRYLSEIIPLLNPDLRKKKRAKKGSINLVKLGFSRSFLLLPVSLRPPFSSALEELLLLIMAEQVRSQISSFFLPFPVIRFLFALGIATNALFNMIKHSRP